MATPLRADDEIAGGLYEKASDHSPSLPIEMIIPRMGPLLDFLMIKTRELSQSQLIFLGPDHTNSQLMSTFPVKNSKTSLL